MKVLKTASTPRKGSPEEIRSAPRALQLLRSNRSLRSLTLAGLLCAFVPIVQRGHAQRVDPIFLISSPNHDYSDALITIPVPEAFAAKLRASSGRWYLTGGIPSGDGTIRRSISPYIPCQFQTEHGKTTLSFVLSVKKGQTWSFHLVKDSLQADPGVQVSQVGTDVEVKVDGKLFTRYTTHSGPNKPFFYPILTPDQQHLTRRWPVEPNADPAESHDHPHHRGLWFTHSSVNGVDFWTEVETDKVKLGKTVNTGFSNIVSGPVFGEFQATTDWIMPDGKRVATDTRTVHVYPLSDSGRLLDFDITLKPDGGPLLLGDNKDGVFGLRLPDSLSVNPSVKPARLGTGHYINSVGDKDGAAWGKAAEWVDYWGPVGGQTWGVAMFDSPQNFRHPQTWHARDYSLFAVNPLALHDFKLGPKDAGNYTIPANGSLTLHYRLLFHKGDYTAAHVADQYAAFADPPTVEAHWDGKTK